MFKQLTRKKHTTVFVFSCLILAAILAVPQHVAAEGSASLTGNGNGFRANLEWRTSTYGDNVLYRRTLLKVHAQAGEYILLGSSAIDVLPGEVGKKSPGDIGKKNNGDILVFNPGLVTGPIGKEIVPTSTPSFSCLQQRRETGNTAQGRITSREQELRGPQTIANVGQALPGTDNPRGYIPCYYRAPENGIYDVVFFGPAGGNADTQLLPSGVIGDNPANFNADQETSVAAWDVTVRRDIGSLERNPGRLFAYYLAMFTGGNGRPVNGMVYVVTRDGYRYAVDLRGMDPNGFVLYANQVGFLDIDGTPLYRDVLADPTMSFKDQNQLVRLQGNVSLAPPDYPIFFEQPAEETLQAIGIPLVPTPPEVKDFTFTGPRGDNTTTIGRGGTFSFVSNVGGVFEIVVSRDGRNFDPADARNRVLRGVRATSGTTSVEWDGLDNTGEPFPTGTNYLARTSIHGGEFHFPFLDVENSTSGSPALTLINPPNGICPSKVHKCSMGVYDDRGYRTANGTLVGTGINQPLCPNNVGNPPNPLYSDPRDGYDSQSNQRRFGFPSGGNPETICARNGGFGDKKGLDLWTFYPSNDLTTPFNITGPLAVELLSFTATPTADGVAIRWETGFEQGTAGFHLYYSANGSREQAVRVTPSLIQAQGGGAVYTWIDSDPSHQNGGSYWLQELEQDGTTREYGPAVTRSLTGASWKLYVPLAAL